MKTISIEQFHKLLQKPLDNKTLAIDVRTPGEYTSEYIEGIQNYPLDQIESFTPELKKYKSVYVLCNSGNRSSRACTTLTKIGLKSLINVEGGMLAWKKRKYPSIKGKGSISIMRQVQITAGSLVLAGVLLSLYIDPRFIWVSGFVGAGLMFAGLSGTCAMGSLLSQMPWNR